MVNFSYTKLVTTDVKFLQVSAGVRYWEDATVNGIDEDENSPVMPFIRGGRWEPIIEIEVGRILNWPKGVTADIHYKVCDDGDYTLLNEEGEVVFILDGYVPSILYPDGDGYGDYIKMTIDGEGRIAKWRVILDEFRRAADGT